MLFPRKKEKPKMEKIVESKIFTDEQKVNVIKAVVEKNITLSFVPSFTKMKDYYFIMNENIYQYVMTFVDGFKYLYLNTKNDKFINAFVENNYKIEMGYTLSNKNKDYAFVYNTSSFYPFLFVNEEETFYAKEGGGAKNLPGVVSYCVLGQTTLEFLKRVILSDIVLNSDSIITDIGKNNYNYVVYYSNKKTENIPIENKNKKEKDAFMKMVDEELPMSADAKIKVERDIIDENKNRVISNIKSALKNYGNTVQFQSSFINNEEVFEFIKYICKTKNYTYTKAANIFTITLF